jgi:hypothetical protein
MSALKTDKKCVLLLYKIDRDIPGAYKCDEK